MNKKKSKVQGGWGRDLASRDCPKRQQQQQNSAPLGHGSSQAFKYEPVMLKKEPVTKTLDNSGEYVISMEPNGESKLLLKHNFLDEETRKWAFEELKSGLNWKQMSAYEHVQPRLTAWVADCDYHYAGVTHSKADWVPVLTTLRQLVEEETGKVFNSVFANLYRDGHDSVAWHSDDESLFGTHPCIASLSFGDQRNFELRRKPPGLPAKELKELQYEDFPEYLKIPLYAGSLLLMEGASQLDWQHRVPREYHDRKARINLTFRMVLQ